MEYHSTSKSLHKKIEWVKGHQDKGKKWECITDLKDLKLTSVAYLNIWHDWQADQARQKATSFPDADVLPAEKWAVFSCYPITRKIIGKLDQGIHESIYMEPLLEYLHKKTQHMPSRTRPHQYKWPQSIFGMSELLV
jgi:hypothetical protein